MITRLTSTYNAIDLLPLSQIKAHARIEHSLDDAYLTSLTDVVVKMAEVEQKRPIIRGNFEFYSEVWADEYLISHAHKNAVVTVQYVSSTDGNTLKTLNGFVATRNDKLVNVSAVKPDDFYAIVLTYTAGYLLAEVPPATKHAMLVLLTHLYEQRSSTSGDTQVYTVPITHRYLFASGKKHVIF